MLVFYKKRESRFHGKNVGLNGYAACFPTTCEIPGSFMDMKHNADTILTEIVLQSESWNFDFHSTLFVHPHMAVKLSYFQI